MKLNFTKKLIAVVFVIAAFIGRSQTTLLTDTFRVADWGTFNSAKWDIANTGFDWLTDDGSILSTLPPVTPAAFALCIDAAGSDENLTTNAFSTVGFASITVQWTEWRQTGSGSMFLEYSVNGSSWNTVATFTDNTNAFNWTSISPITLPSGAEGKTTVYLRWRVSTTGFNEFIAIDDVNVIAQNSFPVYYYDGSGDLADKNNWGSNTDGTGTRPPNFVNDGQTFRLHNTAAATLVAAWNIQGNGSKLEVGDGTANNVNLTIPSTLALTLTNNAALQVFGGSTLTIQNTTLPVTTSTAVTLSANSTVVYSAAGTSSVLPTVHHNATISGGDKVCMASINTGFNGALTLSGNIVMGNNVTSQLSIAGTLSGSGFIKTSNSRLSITGNGNLGTLNFATGNTPLAINNFTLNRSGGSVTLGTALTVTTNASFTHTNGTLNLNGKLLTLNGAIIFPTSSANGSFSGSTTSSVVINGSSINTITNSMLMDQTSAATRSLRDFTFNRSTRTVNLGNALEIWGTITPSVGTINTNGNLTIKSDASNKGRVGAMTSNGSLSGNVTVEVFKKAGLTNWINLCSGGVIGGHMSGWNSSFAITCLTCPDGTQVGGVTFTSIYTYDETAFVGDETNALHYVEITGLTSIDDKEGYWVFVGNGFPNTTAITIPLTGTVNQKNSANYSLSLTGSQATTNGWNLISNPYPAPISVGNILNAIGTKSTQIDQTFWVYDSNLNTNVPFSATSASSIIPMGQAFSVRALVNPVTFSSDESWKFSGSNNSEVLKENLAAAYFYDDFLLDLTSTSFGKPFYANTYFTFGSTYSTGFDNGQDACLTGNSVLPGLPTIYSSTGGQKFVRNALPTLGGTVNIPLTITTATAGVFQITAKNFNKLPAGACVTLYHYASATSFDLKSGVYNATVSANVTTPQYELRITVNPGTLTSTANNPLCLKGNNGSIIAQGSSSTGPWNYTWKDANNNIIKTALNKTTADTLKNIGVGAYQVDVNTVGGCDNANAAFTLVQTSPLPVSAFTVSNDTMFVNTTVPVNFTNNSTNANAYSWNFGDGNTSALQNPSHAYTTIGHYNVTLNAINTVCGDTAKSSFVIHALNTPTIQSVLSYNNTDNSIKVGKDTRGVYVELAFDKMTKATISASNILGQTLITPMSVEAVSDKFYLDLNAKEQIVFITVATNEKRFTQKIFHNQ